MKLLKRATLKYPAGRISELNLMEIQPKCMRWISDDDNLILTTDFVTESDAIAGLRTQVGSRSQIEAELIGVDLTFHPIAPSAEDRAAVRIYSMLKDGHISADAIAEIIRTETACDKLVESTNLLMAYLIQRLTQPKPAGRDLTQVGLMLDVLTALERAQGQEFPNLRQRLTEDVSQIQLVASVPHGTKLT